MMHQTYPALQNLENESIHSSKLESFDGMTNTNAHDAWETSSNGLCSPRVTNKSYGYNHGLSNEETHNSMYSGRGKQQQQINNNNRTGPSVPINIIYPNVYQQQLQIKGQPINKPSGVKFESNYASNVRGHSTSMDSGYTNMIQSTQQQNSSTTLPPMDMSSWGNNSNDNNSNRSFDRSQLFTRNDSGSQASQNYISPTISHNHNSPVSLSGKSINNNNNNNNIVKDINLEEDPMMSNIYFNTTKNTWDCGICRKSFCEKNDLFQHLRSGTHEPKRFSCSDCGKAFASIGALAQHVEQSGHSRGTKTLLQEVDQFGNNAAIAAAASASNSDRRNNINNNSKNPYNNMALTMQQQQQLMQQSQHQNYMNNNISHDYSTNGGNNININSSNHHHGLNSSMPIPAPPTMSVSRVRFYSGPEFISHHNHHIPPPQPFHQKHQQQQSHGNNGGINSYATSQSIQNNNNNNSFVHGTNAGNGYQYNNINRLSLNNQQIPSEPVSEKSFTHVSQVFNNLKSLSPDRNLQPTDAERRRTISYPDHNLIHNHRPVMPPSNTFDYSNGGGVVDSNNNSFSYSSTTQRPFMNNNSSGLNNSNGGLINNAAGKDSLNSSSAFYTIEELDIDIDGLGLNNNNNNNNYSGTSRVNHREEDIDGANDHGEDYYYEMPLTPKSPRLNAVTNISGGITTGNNVYKQNPLVANSIGFVQPVVINRNATQSPPLLFEPEYTLYFSGASPPRSLHGVCAYMIRDERNDILVAQGTQPLVQIYAGSMRPEYEGLNLGLTEAYRQGIRRLRVAGDSELVFMHLNTGSELRYCQSVYRVVQDISKQVRMMCCNFHEISFDLIMKEDNKAVPLAVLEMTAAFK